MNNNSKTWYSGCLLSIKNISTESNSSAAGLMQYTGSNQYQQQMVVQAKLEIRPMDDVCEQEADRVANTIMQSSDRVCVKVLLKMNTSPTQGIEVPPDREAQISHLIGGGQPLPEPVRTFFESFFGYDFSQVRIHTDAMATELAQALNARAFTVGRDVMFGAGQYAPLTYVGQKLLAHELVHVIQQTRDRIMSSEITRNIQCAGKDIETVINAHIHLNPNT